MKKKKYYTFKEINYMDNGTLTLGNNNFRYYLSFALSMVPLKIVDDIIENCLLLIIERRAKGVYFPKGYLEDKCLIAFSDSYMENAGKSECLETILHEVAHYYLRHRDPYEFELDEGIHDQQEQEANEQVKRWLKEYEEADPISKLDWNLWAKAARGMEDLEIQLEAKHGEGD
jgi:hypothetical protein